MTCNPGDAGAAVGGGVAPGDQLGGGQREVGGHPVPAAAATPASLHKQSKVTRAANEPSAKFSQSRRRPLLGPMLANPMVSIVFYLSS